MARGDYRGCDVCDGKAFYDANLSYEDGRDQWAKDRAPYRIAGAEQYDSAEQLAKWGMRLGYVGDWAVVCHDCSAKHRTAILPLHDEAVQRLQHAVEGECGGLAITAEQAAAILQYLERSNG
jgi:hypothetical protein